MASIFLPISHCCPWKALLSVQVLVSLQREMTENGNVSLRISHPQFPTTKGKNPRFRRPPLPQWSWLYKPKMVSYGLDMAIAFSKKFPTTVSGIPTFQVVLFSLFWSILTDYGTILYWKAPPQSPSAHFPSPLSSLLPTTF